MDYKELGTCVIQYDFPEDIAKNLLAMLEQLGDDVWVRSGIGNENEIQTYRTSTSINFPEKFPLWDETVRQFFIPAVNDYCQKYEVKVSQDEGFQLLRYQPNNEYKFHSDGEWSMYRNVSALIYLNPSEYEGGETYFKNQDLNVKPEKPAIVLFPGNYAYLHSAMPVKSGVKYVLVTWMNDMPVGFGPGIIYDIAKLTKRL